MKLDDGLSELLNVQIVLGPCLMLHFEFTEFCNGSWAKFQWIECERDLPSHHFCERLDSWMMIFSIYCDFEWKNCRFHQISYEIVKIMEIVRKLKFTTWNWCEICFGEMLKTAFEREFSVNVYLLTNHYFMSFGSVFQFL